MADRYRLERVIGRGGMSTVYRATDELLGRTVAVKVLLAALADQDATYAERFAREARAAAGLATSSVVTVYDTGVDALGEQYIVMEYIAGHSLAEMLADGHPLEVAEALRIAERVADALRVAHAAGILHRDIKPANVMVADDGTVKVLDFGIARRLDGTTLTQGAAVVGTAAYMAPERALGRPGDARSDVYSLGCLLYAMLTGRPPFTGDLAAVLLNQQVNAAPSAPSELRRSVPPALDALVLAMLAKDPEARPQRAEEVRDRLRELSEGPAGAETAATTPLAIPAPTVPLARREPGGGWVAGPGGGRGTEPRPGWRNDYRRRAVLMALLTALVALGAVAVLSGGGSSHRTTSSRARHHSVARAPARATTHTASAPAPGPTKPTGQPAPKAHGPAAGPPPGHGGRPPGQGGPAPGHGKGHSGPGGH